MSEEEILKLKHLLVSHAFVQPAYELWHSDFAGIYTEFTHNVIKTALAELHGEGLFTSISGMNCVNLTGEGIQAARLTYPIYTEKKKEREKTKDEMISREFEKIHLELKQLRFSTKTNWLLLIITLVSLIITVLALFK